MLQLVAEGTIGLDDPVDGCLPEFAVDRRITARTLLQHTSRLVNFVAPDASPEIPGPYAHACYSYVNASERTTADVTRHNPSWISTGGDMISTVQDLHTFVSALTGASVGHAAPMYSTPDGSKALTAALNCVDDADPSMAAAFRNAQQRLVNEVFCGGQADPAQTAD
ncbi:serine hydrolase [Nonomuraea antimicrobica]